MDCDLGEDCGMPRDELLSALEEFLKQETELLRTYVIASERIHEFPNLKERLQNFAEGNAKRSRQLQDEIQNLHGS